MAPIYQHFPPTVTPGGKYVWLLKIEVDPDPDGLHHISTPGGERLPMKGLDEQLLPNIDQLLREGPAQLP